MFISAIPSSAAPRNTSSVRSRSADETGSNRVVMSSPPARQPHPSRLPARGREPNSGHEVVTTANETPDLLRCRRAPPPHRARGSHHDDQSAHSGTTAHRATVAGPAHRSYRHHRLLLVSALHSLIRPTTGQ